MDQALCESCGSPLDRQEETLFVSIVYRPEPGPVNDQRPREIQINRYKLPRVGESITWNDWPYNRSRVIEVSHEFPSHNSRHVHSVTLIVEDEPAE